jgi:alkaline phosphatase
MSKKKVSKNGAFSRRDFLKTGALSGVLLGSGTLINGCASGNGKARPGDAKNIIFMVSDGMSTGTLTNTDHFLRRSYGRPSNWISLYEQNRVARGLMDMTSGSSIVTDSAAAASSWGCGRRLTNGRVNMTDDEQSLKTILEIFRDAGKATGLATTTTITHATPAGFGANVMARGEQATIATQYLERGYDVLLGGGNIFYSAEHRDDGRDLYSEHSQAGYKVVRKKEDLKSFNGDEKLLGIFYDSHVPYTLDHMNTEEYRRDIPTIAEMTESALKRLSRNPNGFILQVEGGKVDHAAHGNDAAGLIYDQIAFDDAIGKVLEFTENRNDTLVIITTDHGNANPGLNGVGSGYGESEPRFDRLAEFRHTNNWLLPQLDENSSVSRIRELVEYATKIEIRRDEAEILRKSYAGDYENLHRMMSRPWPVMGQILANYLAFNWIGTSHTSDYVELAAYGPGSDRIGPFTKNTDMFHLMVEMAGVQAYQEA